MSANWWHEFVVSAEAVRLATRLAVLGTGSALPGHAIATGKLLELVAPHLTAGTLRVAAKIALRLGIESRHIVRSFDAPIEAPRVSDTAPKLAASAVRAALSEAGCDVSVLRFLLGHTATPHTLLPGNIAWVADELQYGGAHSEIRQACTGFAAATIFGSAMIANGLAPIAIVGSETGSVFFDPRQIAVDSSQLVNLVQMGDGAGAIVLGPLTEPAASRIETVFYGSLGGARPPGLALLQGGSAAPQITGSPLPQFTHNYAAIRDNGMALLRACLEAAVQAGVVKKDVSWWIPHQVNGRMPELCAKWLGLAPEKVICDATLLGNLGSAAIWVALDRLRRSGRLAPGDRVVVLGAEATKYMYGGFVYAHGERQNGAR
jgi:3-oxoacyl-[acyl-carrier-protein] synthase III